LTLLASTPLKNLQRKSLLSCLASFERERERERDGILYSSYIGRGKEEVGGESELKGVTEYCVLYTNINKIILIK
jgi:hypothetical protein